MHSAFLPRTQSETDYMLLQEFLCQNLYADADLIYDTDPDELLEYCFRQYYVFLLGSHELTVWYQMFQRECYRLLALRGIFPANTEYRLRSQRFCLFAQKLLSMMVSEVRTTTQPPGEDSTAVPA
ncbi:hypothetical protein BH09BAC4_BH09BAC4_28210 [soil metagenome]